MTDKLTDIIARYAAILVELDGTDGDIDGDLVGEIAECEADLLDKVERIERLVESLEATAKAVRERANKQIDHARALERRAERVHSWVISQLEAAGLDSYETESYTLRRRVSTPHLAIDDSAALREWLLANQPAAIRVVEELDKRAILATAKVQDVPGVRVERGTHWRVQ